MYGKLGTYGEVEIVDCKVSVYRKGNLILASDVFFLSYLLDDITEERKDAYNAFAQIIETQFDKEGSAPAIFKKEKFRKSIFESSGAIEKLARLCNDYIDKYAKNNITKTHISLAEETD